MARSPSGTCPSGGARARALERVKDMEDPLEMLKRVVRKIGSSGKIVKMLQAVALSKETSPCARIIIISSSGIGRGTLASSSRDTAKP